MTDYSLETLRRDHARLAARIVESLDAAERLQLKDDIVALFRRSENAIAELADFKESIRALIDAFKAMPPLADAVSVRHDHLGASTAVERGWSLLAGGDWVGAETALREALSRDAHHADAQALLGWALMRQDRADEALQRCLNVLVRIPDHGLARTAVGAICLRKGITGEAIEHLSRAASSTGDPRATLYANYWLGVAYLSRDMVRDAVDVLGRAVALGPNLAEAWAELGRAQWLARDQQAAITSWHTGQSIRHSPFSSQSADLLRRSQAGETLPRSPLD